jgi:hypothetical protein
MDPADEAKGLFKWSSDFAVTMTESNFSCPSRSQRHHHLGRGAINHRKGKLGAFRTCTLR